MLHLANINTNYNTLTDSKHIIRNFNKELKKLGSVLRFWCLYKKKLKKKIAC